MRSGGINESEMEERSRSVARRKRTIVTRGLIVSYVQDSDSENVEIRASDRLPMSDMSDVCNT
jgi:hypothetical protein